MTKLSTTSIALIILAVLAVSGAAWSLYATDTASTDEMSSLDTQQ